MKRAAWLGLICVVSAIFVASILLWVRSEYAYDDVVRYKSNSYVLIQSSDSRLAVSFYDRVNKVSPEHAPEWTSTSDDPLDLLQQPGITTTKKFILFRWIRGELESEHMGPLRYSMVVVDYPELTAISFIVLFTIFLMRKKHARNDSPSARGSPDTA